MITAMKSNKTRHRGNRDGAPVLDVVGEDLSKEDLSE